AAELRDLRPRRRLLHVAQPSRLEARGGGGPPARVVVRARGGLDLVLRRRPRAHDRRHSASAPASVPGRVVTGALAVAVDEGRDHLRGGRPGAAVTLVEYGDYECPYSRAAFRSIERVERRVGEGLCFVFR